MNSNDLRLQILTTLTWVNHQRDLLMEARWFQHELWDDYAIHSDEFVEEGIHETLQLLHYAIRGTDDLIAALQDHLQRLDQEAEDEAAMIGSTISYIYLI